MELYASTVSGGVNLYKNGTQKQRSLREYFELLGGYFELLGGYGYCRSIQDLSVHSMC